jgi:hypothetical protein
MDKRRQYTELGYMTAVGALQDLARTSDAPYILDMGWGMVQGVLTVLRSAVKPGLEHEFKGQMLGQLEKAVDAAIKAYDQIQAASETLKAAATKPPTLN